MRLIFKVGIIPEQVGLQASEESSPIGRWFAANLDLRTVLSVVTLGCTLLPMYTSTANRLTVVEQQQKATRDLVDANDRRIGSLSKRVADETVPFKTYQHDTDQLGQTLGNLQSGQQQIYNFLIQRSIVVPAR